MCFRLISKKGPLLHRKQISCVAGSSYPHTMAGVCQHIPQLLPAPHITLLSPLCQPLGMFQQDWPSRASRTAAQRALPTQVSTRGAATALPGGVCFQHCSGTTWPCRSTASPLVVEGEEKTTPALHRQTHCYLIALHRGLPAGQETKQPCYRGNRTAAREAVFPERQVRNSPC